MPKQNITKHINLSVSFHLYLRYSITSLLRLTTEPLAVNNIVKRSTISINISFFCFPPFPPLVEIGAFAETDGFERFVIELIKLLAVDGCAAQPS